MQRIILIAPHNPEQVPDLGGAALPAAGGHDWFELGRVVSTRLLDDGQLEVTIEAADGIEVVVP